MHQKSKKKNQSYTVRKTETPETQKFNCPCCGSEMNPEQILEKSTVYRCKSCGIK